MSPMTGMIGTRGRYLVLLAGTGAALLACDLDVSNPNAPTDEQALGTAAGLKAVAIGMQGRLGNSIEETVFISGLVSGEIGNTNATPSLTREFQNFPDPGANSQIEETNPELDDLWTKHYGIVKSANDILSNVDDVQLDPGTKSGMVALARLLKAMAFSVLIENFEQIPIETGTPDPAPFVDRATVLQAAVTLLADAAAQIASTAPSAEFTSSILASGFDLSATVSATQARLSLLNGDFQNAITFANAVPGGATSVLTFNAQDPNPVKNVYVDLGYFGALASFRANAEGGDTRVNRFTTSTVITGFGGATLNGLNVYQNDGDPFPVFTADELTLIRAEAEARLNRLPQAITEINVVRQRAGLGQKTSGDLPTQQAVLDEIFVQRTYSLFSAGLHWGDLRRFGRIAQAKVTWLPYPFGERATNPNTPPNP